MRQFNFNSTLDIYRAGRSKAESDCAAVSAEIDVVVGKADAIG